MSFLKKILNGKKPELSDALDLLHGLEKKMSGSMNQSSGSSYTNAPSPSPFKAETPRDDYYDDSPSGFSWGERMPAEENQFNYPGPYDDYFQGILQQEFPGYQLSKQKIARKHPVTIFTLLDGTRQALVIELISESSDVYKLRRDCQKAHIPYLRFYYDHHGWWNTRAYVIDRVSKALGR